MEIDGNDYHIADELSVSYNDLQIINEVLQGSSASLGGTGTVYRYERSGFFTGFYGSGIHP